MLTSASIAIKLGFVKVSQPPDDDMSLPPLPTESQTPESAEKPPEAMSLPDTQPGRMTLQQKSLLLEALQEATAGEDDTEEAEDVEGRMSEEEEGLPPLSRIPTKYKHIERDVKEVGSAIREKSGFPPPLLSGSPEFSEEELEELPLRNRENLPTTV